MKCLKNQDKKNVILTVFNILVVNSPFYWYNFLKWHQTHFAFVFLREFRNKPLFKLHAQTRLGFKIFLNDNAHFHAIHPYKKRETHNTFSYVGYFNILNFKRPIQGFYLSPSQRATDLKEKINISYYVCSTK